MLAKKGLFFDPDNIALQVPLFFEFIVIVTLNFYNNP